MRIQTRNLIENEKRPAVLWRLLSVVGLILFGVGISTFFSPEESYIALAPMFGLSFFFLGLFEIIFAMTNRKGSESWFYSFSVAVVTLLVGTILMYNPPNATVTIPLFIGFMLLFHALPTFGLLMDLKNCVALERGVLILVEMMISIFSCILIWNPDLSGITVVTWTESAFLFFGIFSIYLSFKMRNLLEAWLELEKSL